MYESIDFLYRLTGKNVELLLNGFACNIQDEVRQTIELSKFGFLQNGILKVNFSDMVVRGNHDKVLVSIELCL